MARSERGPATGQDAAERPCPAAQAPGRREGRPLPRGQSPEREPGAPGHRRDRARGSHAREVNRLLDALEPAHYPLFFTAVCTGVRLGELLALQWGDLDETAHRLHVRRTAYQGAFYVPKTKRSRRAIDVGDQWLGVLSRWRREQHGESVPPPDALLFPASSGGPLDPDNLRHRVWAPALAKAKLRHVRIHSLRHTFASMLIAQGENVKYISSQLGHASVQITLDRYGHLFPDEKRTSATRFEAQLAAAVPSSSHPAELAGTPETSLNCVEDGVALTPRHD